MTPGVAEHLAAGGDLVMVNPGSGTVPDDLPGATALFIDRENTGLDRASAADLVHDARGRGLYAVIRCDGLAADELSLCSALAPDALVLPQIVHVGQIEAARRAVASTIALIPQVETEEAVKDIAALSELDTPDAFLIGPNDLAAAMGHAGNPGHAVVTDAIAWAGEVLRTAGRPFGLPTLTSAARAQWSARGAQLFYLTPQALVEMEPGH